MPRVVLHVDLDQFLAAVEVLRRPELRGRPVVVGGDGDPTQRGVVSTASYEARAHGVRSGTPLRTAARRCPEAVFLPVDRPVYEAASETVMDVLRRVAASVGGALEVLGWDEAFLGAEVDTPEDAERLARRIQADVLSASGLHCSVGIGDNRLQAKTATEFGKPAGVFRLGEGTWADWMGERPTDALWGVGGKTAKRLAALGIGTVGELAAADPDRLAAELGPTTGPWLVRLARGRDSARVSAQPRRRRSLGHEVTYQVDVADWAQVRAEVARLARLVAAETAADEKAADPGTAAGRPVRVVVKIRFHPFVTVTHGRAADGSGPEEVEAAALAALERFERRGPVRLVGVRAELAPGSAVPPDPPG